MASPRNRRRQQPKKKVSALSPSAIDEMAAMVDDEPAAIVRLTDACSEIFARCGPNVAPSPEDADRLIAILDNLKAKDVGVTPDSPLFKKENSSGHPQVTYLRLEETDHFEIAIFCLPKSAEIPLHDHPGMTVFSKILFGSLQVRSLDWVNAEDNDGINNSSEKNLAKVVVNQEFRAPCQPMVLYPESGGNVHRFIATSHCAILDVLGPPYSSDRKETYYKEKKPFSKYSRGLVVPEENVKYAWLTAIETDFRVHFPLDHELQIRNYGVKVANRTRALSSSDI